jgi:sortase A
VPIINKYTVNNLNVSVCTVIAKNKMGQAGNYVLAGHRSRVRGRHFNRIIELEPGDLIITENKEAKYTYQVTDVFLITPDETWVMSNDGDRKLITLITCDYRMEPTGRLIVRGELASSEPVEVQTE